MNQNSKGARAGSSDGTPTEPTGAEVAEVVEATPKGVLTVTGVDGLPAVDPLAAAARAVDFIGRRNLGPNAQALVAYIAEQAVNTADLNVVVLEQLAARIINAESPQDILTPFDPTGCDDYLNIPLQINGCTFLESDYSEGFPWYASLPILVPATGEETVITIGGETVMYQVAGFDMHGAWPATAMITKATKPTKAGYYPLSLKLAA